MDLIEKFLREVPKDSDGFEDVEAFWRDSEKIHFPLSKRVKTKLIDGINTDISRLQVSFRQIQLTRHSLDSLTDESDTDFDYDTASSISVEIEELLADEEPPSESEPEPEPEDDNHEQEGNSKLLVESTESTPASATVSASTSALDISFKSIQLTPEPPIPSDPSLSEASLAKVNVTSTTKNEVSKETVSSPSEYDMSVPDYSLSTARGDKSSLVTDKSSISVASVRSTRSKGSAAKTPQIEEELREAPKSNLPSSIKKNGRNSIDRRVSFNASIDLSPERSSLNDASTVREDQSYDYGSRSSALVTASNVTTPSTNKSEVLSPTKASAPSISKLQVLSSPKSFSRKSLESILEPSTLSSIVAPTPSPSVSNKPNKPSSASSASSAQSDNYKSALSSKSRKSIEDSKSSIQSAKSSTKSLSNRSSFSLKSKGWDDDEKEEQIEEGPLTPESSKSKISEKSVASSVKSVASSVKSGASTTKNSKISSASKQSIKSDEEENTSRLSKISRSFESASSVPAKDLSQLSSTKHESEDSFDHVEAATYDDGGYDDEPPAMLDEEIQNISEISAKSSTSKPIQSETGGASSSKKTPSSSAQKLSTPGSVYTEAISTPGSNEFPRGIRISDESFRLNDSSLLREEDNSDERSTDKEELDASAFSQSRAKAAKDSKKSKKSEASKEVELSESFIDTSYLNTISSANKKYAGKELLQETKRLKKQQQKIEAEKKKKRKVLISLSDEEQDHEEYDHDEDEDYDEDEDSEEFGLRRSKRATKGRRFQFWKGERPIYQEGTVIGVVEPDPTPKRGKKRGNSSLNVQRNRKDNKNENKRKRTSTTEESAEESDHGDTNLRLVDQKKKKQRMHDGSEDEVEVLPPIELPKQFQYTPAAKVESISIYDNFYEQITNEAIVCSRAALPPPQPLPRTGKRPPGKNGVGSARHLFHITERPGSMPGWIAGFMDLPPQAIKDPENVGPLAQIFFISECQPESLEFALANPEDDEWNEKEAQRVILSPGDSFYVPPGNMYRLENHSKVKLCKINWLIIKPLQELDPAAGSSVSNATQVKK